MIQYDVLLEDLGGFGTSQIILVFILCYFNISAGMNTLATVFIAHTPHYRYLTIYINPLVMGAL